MDPATISILLSATIVGLISITTGRSLYKDLYNSRFNGWGYRIDRYKPGSIGYNTLFSIISSEAALGLSSAVTFVNNVKVSTNVIKCKVLGCPPTVRCRIGIQMDGIIYLIVWDPLIFRRKYSLAYYARLLAEHESGDGGGGSSGGSGSGGAPSPIPLIPILASLLVKN